MISVFLAVYSGIASSVKYTVHENLATQNFQFPKLIFHALCNEMLLLQRSEISAGMSNEVWNEEVTWERVFDILKKKKLR